MNDRLKKALDQVQAEDELKQKTKEYVFQKANGCKRTKKVHFKLPNMPGGMPSLRRSCLAAQTMPESSQFIVSSILFLCYTVCENNSTLQSTAW